MKTTTRFDCSRTAQRGGFTLIELMVVITIIAALLALTASATMKVLATSQANNTQTRLDAVQSQLSRAWSKVKDEAYYKSDMSELVPGTVPPVPVGQWILTNLAQVGASDPNAKERVRVIYVKLRLRQAFPMDFSEALNPYPLPPLRGYVAYLGSLGIAGTSGAAYESSACLLMALQRGASGAGINPEQIAGGGALTVAPTLGGPGGNTIPYLTDSWGRPIFFSRFPVGSTYLNPPSGIPNPPLSTGWTALTGTTEICYSQAGNNDPGDPQGYLQTPAWYTYPSPLGFTMAQQFSAFTKQYLATGNTSYKLAPMVASGGPNNWIKSGGIPPLDPITFYTTPGSGALFSTP